MNFTSKIITDKIDFYFILVVGKHQRCGEDVQSDQRALVENRRTKPNTWVSMFIT